MKKSVRIFLITIAAISTCNIAAAAVAIDSRVPEINGQVTTLSRTGSLLWIGGQFLYEWKEGNEVRHAVNLMAWDLEKGRPRWAYVTNPGGPRAMAFDDKRTLAVTGSWLQVNGKFHPYVVLVDVYTGKLLGTRFRWDFFGAGTSVRWDASGNLYVGGLTFGKPGVVKFNNQGKPIATFGFNLDAFGLILEPKPGSNIVYIGDQGGVVASTPRRVLWYANLGGPARCLLDSGKYLIAGGDQGVFIIEKGVAILGRISEDPTFAMLAVGNKLFAAGPNGLTEIDLVGEHPDRHWQLGPQHISAGKALALYPGGLLLGGAFNSFEGEPRRGLAGFSP